MPIKTIKMDMNEVITKKVAKCNKTAARVYVPVSWLGKKVIVGLLRLQEEKKESLETVPEALPKEATP